MLFSFAETDWLGSRPIFYNEKTLKISDNINEVIDFSDLEFHPEGFNNYLRFGYTVFGQTMVKNVKALRYASSIKIENNKLIITEMDDPVKKVYGHHTYSSKEVMEQIIAFVQSWGEEKSTPIVLPLSGGNDSKLLAFSLKNRPETYACTYGFSRVQSESYEAVKARRTAEICNIQWESVPIGDFHHKKYYDHWNNLFGPSVHSHGEYQMEFYDHILQSHPRLVGSRVLSGIIGDGWAGNVKCEAVNCTDDLIKLGYTHDMCADPGISLMKDDGAIRSVFLEVHKEELKEQNWRVIHAMRLKIMLLSYLFTVPKDLGFEVWSPFLDMETAMNMVNLPWKEKEQRKWQSDFFEKYGLQYGWMKKECDYNTDVDYWALLKNPVEPLDVELLGRYIKKDYLEAINRTLRKKPIRKLAAKPRTVKNMCNKVIDRYDRQFLLAVNKGYRILKPIEYLLKQAELCNKG